MSRDGRKHVGWIHDFHAFAYKISKVCRKGFEVQKEKKRKVQIFLGGHV